MPSPARRSSFPTRTSGSTRVIRSSSPRGGKIVAGPLREALGILYAQIDLERVAVARRALDVVGHYARPDLFQLHVNAKPGQPVVFAKE